MKTWVRKSLKVGVLSAGILLFAGGTAQADWNTSDNDGVLTGNQVGVSVNAPINICGNAVALLGDAGAACSIEESAALESGGDWNSSDNDGVGTGNQVAVPVNIPINICGNAVAVLGDAMASCQIDGGSGGGSGTTYPAESWNSSDNDGVLTGNQVLAVVNAPINICGNAVAVLGDAMAACAIGGDGSGADEAGDWNTSGNDGVLTGNQVAAILNVPVNVCGNAVAILGDAAAACTIGGGSDGGDDDDDDNGGGSGDDDDCDDDGSGSGDDYSGASGHQSRRGHRESLPVGLDKLTKTVKADKVLGTEKVARHAARTEGWNTSDNDGVLTGNQLALAVDLPLTIAGNAVAVAGDAVAGAKV